MEPEEEHIGAILQGCKSGDASAQEKLYRRFYPRFYRLCCRYTGTDAVAEEAVNSGFLKILTRINTYNAAKGTLENWMQTIFIRTCITMQSAEIRHQQRNGAAADHTSFLPADALAKLFGGDLLREIQQLPPTTRMVFNLYELDGYSHAEIATIVGITEGTSRWHLSDGKTRLRQSLSHLQNPLP